MKARLMLGNAGFDPEEVAALTAIFEAAWARTASKHPETQWPAARERLAGLVIQMAPAGRRHAPEVFETLVLQAFENPMVTRARPPEK
jgi:hypothetical protein